MHGSESWGIEWPEKGHIELYMRWVLAALYRIGFEID